MSFPFYRESPCPSGLLRLSYQLNQILGSGPAARILDENTVRLVVVAHIRHVETPYGSLLARDWERREARAEVDEHVRTVLAEREARE